MQIVYANRRGSRTMEHIGSAHDEVELELLKTVARQRLAAGQTELDLGLEPASGGPLPILGSRMATLVDALVHGYRVLGLEHATGGDEVFAQLVLARIIEPTSKLDSARVLAEAGIRAGVLSDAQPTVACVRRTLVAAAALGRLRRPGRVGAGVAGAVRRVHVVLRDR